MADITLLDKLKGTRGILKEVEQVLVPELESGVSYARLWRDPTENPMAVKQYLNQVNRLTKAWKFEELSLSEEGGTGVAGPEFFWGRPEGEATREELEEELEASGVEEAKKEKMVKALWKDEKEKKGITKEDIAKDNRQQAEAFLGELTQLKIGEERDKNQLGFDEAWKEYIGSKARAIYQIEIKQSPRAGFLQERERLVEARKAAEEGDYGLLREMVSELELSIDEEIGEDNWAAAAEKIEAWLTEQLAGAEVLVTDEERMILELETRLRDPKLYGEVETGKMMNELEERITKKGTAATEAEEEYLVYLKARKKIKESKARGTKIRETMGRWLGKDVSLERRLDMVAELFLRADVDPVSLLTGEGARSLGGEAVMLLRGLSLSKTQRLPLMTFLLIRAHDRKLMLIKRFVDTMIAKENIYFQLEEGKGIVMANVGKDAAGAGRGGEGLMLQDILDELAKAEEVDRRFAGGGLVNYEWLELLARLTAKKELNKQKIAEFGEYDDRKDMPLGASLLDGKTIGRLLTDKDFVEIINDPVWYPGVDEVTGRIKSEEFHKVREKAMEKLGNKHSWYKVKAAEMWLEVAQSVKPSYWTLEKMKNLEDYYSRNMGFLGCGLPITEIPANFNDEDKQALYDLLNNLSLFSLGNRSWNGQFLDTILNPEEVVARMKRRGVSYVPMKEWRWKEGGVVVEQNEKALRLVAKHARMTVDEFTDRMAILALRRKQLAWMGFGAVDGKYKGRAEGKLEDKLEDKPKDKLGILQEVPVGEAGGTRLPFGYNRKEHRKRLLAYLRDRDEKYKGRSNLKAAGFGEEFIEGEELERTLMDVFRHQEKLDEEDLEKGQRNHLVAWVAMGMRVKRQTAHKDASKETGGKKEVEIEKKRLAEAARVAAGGDYSLLTKILEDYKWSETKVSGENWEKRVEEVSGRLERVAAGSKIDLKDVGVWGVEAFSWGLEHLLRPENEAALRQVGLDNREGREWLRRLQVPVRKVEKMLAEGADLEEVYEEVLGRPPDEELALDDDGLRGAIEQELGVIKAEQGRFTKAVKLELVLEDLTTFGFKDKWEEFESKARGEEIEQEWVGRSLVNPYLEEMSTKESARQSIQRMDYYEAYRIAAYRMFVKMVRGWRPQEEIPGKAGTAPVFLNMEPEEWHREMQVLDRGDWTHDDAYFQFWFMSLFAWSKLKAQTIKADVAADPNSRNHKELDELFDKGMFKRGVRLPSFVGPGLENRGEDEEGYSRAVGRVLEEEKDILRLVVSQGLYRELSASPVVTASQAFGKLIDERMFYHALPVFSPELWRRIQESPYLLAIIDMEDEVSKGNVEMVSQYRTVIGSDGKQHYVPDNRYQTARMALVGGLLDYGSDRQAAQIYLEAWNKIQVPWVESEQAVNMGLYLMRVMGAWDGLDNLQTPVGQFDHFSRELAQAGIDPYVWDTREVEGKKQYAFAPQAWVAICRDYYGFDLRNHEALVEKFGSEENVRVFRGKFKETMRQHQAGVMKAVWGIDEEDLRVITDEGGLFSVYVKTTIWRLLGIWGAKGVEEGEATGEIKESERPGRLVIPGIELGLGPKNDLPLIVMGGKDEKTFKVKIYDEDGKEKGEVDGMSVRAVIKGKYNKDPYYRELPMKEGEDYKTAAEMAWLDAETKEESVGSQLRTKLGLIRQFTHASMTFEQVMVDENLRELWKEMCYYATRVGIGPPLRTMTDLLYGEMVVDSETGRRYRQNRWSDQENGFKALRQYFSTNRDLRQYLFLMYYEDVGAPVEAGGDWGSIDDLIDGVLGVEGWRVNVKDWLAKVKDKAMSFEVAERELGIGHEQVARGERRRLDIADYVEAKVKPVGLLFRLKRIVQKRNWDYLMNRYKEIERWGVGVTHTERMALIGKAREAANEEVQAFAAVDIHTGKVVEIKNWFNRNKISLVGAERLVGWLEERDVESFRAQVAPFFLEFLNEANFKWEERKTRLYRVRAFGEALWKYWDVPTRINWWIHRGRHGKFPLYSTVLKLLPLNFGEDTLEQVRMKYDPGRLFGITGIGAISGGAALGTFVARASVILANTTSTLSQIMQGSEFLQGVAKASAQLAEWNAGWLGGLAVGLISYWAVLNAGKAVNSVVYTLLEHAIRNAGLVVRTDIFEGFVNRFPKLRSGFGVPGFRGGVWLFKKEGYLSLINLPKILHNPNFRMLNYKEFREREIKKKQLLS